MTANFRRVMSAVILVGLVGLAACGSGDASSGRTKNAALDTPLDEKPETAAATGVPDIVLVGLGDSYGSGEGNPAVPTGDPNTTQWWGLSNHSSDGAALCHRSSKAAFVQAAMEMQRRFPSLNIYWKHFACTGAQTEHLAAESYDATVDENGNRVMDSATDTSQTNAPQFDDAIAWVNTLPWGDKPKKIDAVYMSIGGNDVGGWQESDPKKRKLGLGAIIAACVSPGFTDCDEGDKRSYIESAANYAKVGGGLSAAYSSLNTLLDQKAAAAGVTLGKKLLNAYPNLIQSDVNDPATSKNAFCGDEGEGTPFDPVGRMNSGLLANSDSGDWTFVGETIMKNLKETQEKTIDDLHWDLVRFDSAANESAGIDTFTAWTPHGICATTNWVHDMAGAAALQGNDMSVALWGLITTSYGAIHPNPTGWRDFANRAAYHLEKVVSVAATSSTTTSSSTTSPAPTTTASSGGSSATPSSASTTTVAADMTGIVSPNWSTLRPALPAEASPGSSAAVPSSLRTDSDGVLTVSSATWTSGSGIRALRWVLSVGSRSIDCLNCAYLDENTKRLVKDVLTGSAGAWVTSVNGFDPSVTSPTDNRGTGWGAEFLVASPSGGNAIADWVLKCTSATVCRSTTLKISEMMWFNRYWGIERSCTEQLHKTGPSVAYPDADMATTDPIELREFAIDRIRLSSAHYVPAYQRTGDVRRLIGWRETGCSS